MHFNRMCAASLGLLALSAAGCASSQGGAGSASVADEAALGKIGPALLQWSGNFRSTQQQSGTFNGQMGRNQASGSVVLTAPNAAQMHVKIQASLPVTDPVRLAWAIVPGPCGSNAIPLQTVAQFPEIPVSNGNAGLDEMLSLPFPTTGNYHVNVFNEGTTGSDESDVMVCADLHLERRSN